MLWVVDAAAPQWAAPSVISAREKPQKNAIGARKTAIAVLNKIDLAPGAGEGREVLEISAKTGEGIDRLLARLEAAAASATESGAGAPLLTRARHRAELTAVQQALERFGDPGLSPELKAEEIRLAAHHLGRLTGRIGVEEVLGTIFSQFCIGK